MRVEFGRDHVAYQSRRCWPDRSAVTNIRIEPGEPFSGGGLDVFLTARFRLYSSLLGRLVFANVEHPPWPLQRARIVELNQTLSSAAGLPNLNGPPLVHFSPGVAVRIGRPMFV
jgi:hypothetical protein